jgi:hypothetical protein
MVGRKLALVAEKALAQNSNAYFQLADRNSIPVSRLGWHQEKEEMRTILSR